MSNKIWLVTGCSSGIGRALVKVLADLNIQVIATVRQSSQISEIESLGKSVKGIVLDVTYPDQIEAARQHIEKESGRIDVLVNNAGYGSLGPVEEIGEEEMMRQFDVNVFGAVRMIQMVLPFMRAHKYGHILNITSIAGLSGFPGMGIYNGSKFALEGIGEGLAADVAPLGIRVTNVAPGPFRTDWGGRSATYTEKSIDDYAESGHKRMSLISEGSGKQVGDPIRAAKAMIELVEIEKPPVHLLLGGPAYTLLEKKMEKFNAEIDQFESLGRPTDYSEDELTNPDG